MSFDSHAIWRPVLKAVSSVDGRARLSIFIFHRVLAKPDPLRPEEPDCDRFDAICRLIASAYTVLPLREAADQLKTGSLKPGCACITFDDGYADNLTLAQPILQRWGLTATFFIATGFLGGGRMWNDTVIESIRLCRRSTLPKTILRLDDTPDLPLETQQQKLNAIAHLLPLMKYKSQPQRLQLSEVLAEWAGENLDDGLMLTPAQLRELSCGGMTIGAHTVSHPILAGLDDDAAEREIRQSREALRDIIDSDVDLFAYPNGRPERDYSSRDVGLVRAAGFRFAVSTAHGVNGPDVDGFQLRRFTPWDTGMHRFALRLARNYWPLSA